MPRVRSRGTSTRTLPSSIVNAVTGAFDASRVGRRLGSIAAGVFVGTLQEFERQAVRRGSPLQTFVNVIRGARVNRRTRRMPESSGVLSARHRVHRWYWPLMAEAFGLYCLLRQRATPTAQQPTLGANVSHVPRRLEGALRSRGVRQARARARAQTIRQQAADNLASLWRSMRGVHVCLWADNFYRPHYGVNPLRVGAHVNATVVAVLHCPRLPPAPPLPDVTQLVSRRHDMAHRLYAWQFHLQAEVQAIGTRGVLRDEMRIPLDVRRISGRSLQWHPLSVNNHRVQTNHELVQLLQFVAFVGGHVHARPINVHYRLAKMFYGQRTQRWDTRGSMRNHPLLEAGASCGSSSS